VPWVGGRYKKQLVYDWVFLPLGNSMPQKIDKESSQFVKIDIYIYIIFWIRKVQSSQMIHHDSPISFKVCPLNATVDGSEIPNNHRLDV